MNRTVTVVLAATALMVIHTGLNAGSAAVRPPDDRVLTEEQWLGVDLALDRALAWLASQQKTDGSFRTIDDCQPAVTSLCVLAFLSAGHPVGQDIYGARLSDAVEFVLSCQKPDGLLCHKPRRRTTPTAPEIYNHAIGGLLLTQAHGMTRPEQAAPIRDTVENAIQYSLRHQARNPRYRVEAGGWRYVDFFEHYADLSITSWQLLFLRSARNSGFELPADRIDAAMVYVKRCYNRRKKTFAYANFPSLHNYSLSMAGAGILSLSMGGLHDTHMASDAGDWILRNRSKTYNARGKDWRYTQYHDGVFYCTQGMHQLGGRYWQEFFPPLVRIVLEHQGKDGSWEEANEEAAIYGNVYTTGLVVLSLSVPNQILPSFQR